MDGWKEQVREEGWYSYVVVGWLLVRGSCQRERQRDREIVSALPLQSSPPL